MRNDSRFFEYKWNGTENFADGEYGDDFEQCEPSDMVKLEQADY